jgi:hypothetical protein
LRGYVAAHSGLAKRFVEASAAVSQAVAVMAKSLEYHLAHDTFTGLAHHHGRLATIAARASLTPEAFIVASKAHHFAGLSKHNISKSSGRRSIDRLIEADPWLGKSLPVVVRPISESADLWSRYQPSSVLPRNQNIASGCDAASCGEVLL